MKHVGVFVDISNLYYSVNTHYKKKLNYTKYMDFIKDLGNIQHAIAYGAQMSNEADSFIYSLQQIGFRTKYKKPKEYHKNKRKADWDVGIAVDMINMVDKCDMMVLGTADSDMCPVIEHVMSKGINVIIFACGISSELHDIATRCIEIPESLLETINTTK